MRDGEESLEEMDEGNGGEREEEGGMKEIWIKDEGRKVLEEKRWRRKEGRACRLRREVWIFIIAGSTLIYILLHPPTCFLSV